MFLVCTVDVYGGYGVGWKGVVGTVGTVEGYCGYGGQVQQWAQWRVWVTWMGTVHTVEGRGYGERVAVQSRGEEGGIHNITLLKHSAYFS